jgi:hypothetical protein
MKDSVENTNGDESTGRVLVITHSFPPGADIGARRWFKISKYIAKSNYQVFVLTVSDEATSSYSHESGIFIKRIKGNYPRTINAPKKHLFSKLLFRFTMFIMKCTVKGTIYDKGVFMRKKITGNAISIIEEKKIKNVIVTGAPFSYFRYALELKKHFPGLNVLCDMRDPWTDGHYYGFSDLAQKRMEKEREYENYVMTNANVVFTPTDSMTRRLISRYGSITNQDKFLTLPHPYDPEEIGVIKSKKFIDAQFKFLSGGTLDLFGIESVFEVFLKCMLELKKKSPNPFKIEFYSPTVKLKPLLLKYSDVPVLFMPKLPAAAFFDKLLDADFLIIFLPPYVKDFFITKVNEYIAMKRPILLFSPKGEVAEFIDKNNLGVWINLSDSRDIELFPEKIKRYSGNNSCFNYNFNSEQFSGPNIAKRVIEKFI